MTSAEIRQAFLDFFADKQHQIVKSSYLVPGNDPTLLFTNAGMVPFKETFLGQEKRPYTRATSSQCCIRAGGKHNDLENVGYTARHHTFFEMLGNFSFGDYFKREAINFAWTFLTEVLQLPAERLWVTVFDDDDESADIWLNELGVSAERFSRCGEADNFWSMGDTGPCGPCSEIFYDHGEDIPGGPPGSEDADADRYIEIWNLVFMQYERAVDGSLTPLPKPCVDTGMGLERIAAVMQGVHNNYDIDLFRHILQAAAEIVQCDDVSAHSLRVIADHIRSSAFLIAEGMLPSNEGRGYVLRRIIRRAVRHGHQLGVSDNFFYRLVPALAEVMGDPYPLLREKQQHIMDTLLEEERQFAKTLDQGVKILEQAISTLSGADTIPGEIVFRLYDTYGFPADLTADIARERNLQVDLAGFEQHMQQQRAKSQAASQFDVDYTAQLVVDSTTLFQGYEHLSVTAQIVALFQEGQAVDVLNVGDSGQIVLDQTPFYAESGGQIGDQGVIRTAGNEFKVLQTQKVGDAYIHIGHVTQGQFNVKQQVEPIVDAIKRQATALNHSATHLLHAALRQLLGDQVTQKGSLVDADRLRFDFSYPKPLSVMQLQQIEALVNQQIRANNLVQTDVMSADAAMKSGAMALFGEKYSDEVRVLSMGTFSKELCGGTHVKSTGDIGFCKITSETGIAAGVRRIEAVTGNAAQAWITDNEQQLNTLAGLLKSPRDAVLTKVQQLLQRQRDLEKSEQRLKAKLASNMGSDLLSQAVTINGIKVLAVKLEGVDVKSLRDTLDQLKQKLGSAVIVLGLTQASSVNLVAGVTKDYTNRIHAGKLVNFVAQQVGGKGGGRPDMAQAGGNQPEALSDALASVNDWIKQVTEN